MTQRIICPHCHCPIDPFALEVAVSTQAHYRICPECDEPIVWFVSDDALSEVSDSGPAVRKEAFSDKEALWL